MISMKTEPFPSETISATPAHSVLPDCMTKAAFTVSACSQVPALLSLPAVPPFSWPSPATSPLLSLLWQQGSHSGLWAEPALPPPIERSRQGPSPIFHSYKEGWGVLKRPWFKWRLCWIFGLDPSSEPYIAVLWQFKVKGGSEKILFSPCLLPFLCCGYPQIWQGKNGLFGGGNYAEYVWLCNKLRLSIIDQFLITRTAQWNVSQISTLLIVGNQR